LEDYRKRILEPVKKTWIIATLGAAIGGGIGGYISARRGNYIYAGMGAVVGYTIGIIIGLLIGKKTNLKSLRTTENIMDFVLSIASFFMVIAGITGFILTRKWIGIVGALFFGACGVYLLKKCWWRSKSAESGGGAEKTGTGYYYGA
jgi:hypothetical protein